MRLSFIFCFVFVIFSSYAGETFNQVKKRGNIRCGVSQGLAGFSFPDNKGVWRGIDTDVCRAVSLAIFNDATKVKFVPLSSQQRFTALQSGEVDILSRNSTRTLARDTSLGLNFAPVVYYDGQGFMVRKKDGITSVKQLSGATVCMQQGTTTELNASDYFRANKLKMKPVVFETNDEVTNAFLKARCDVLTTDKSGLASELRKVKNPDDYLILPETISKEPLAPAVRHGDDHWLDIVTWSVYALINAEELGIYSTNIESFLKSDNPKVRRFLGLTEGNGKALGLKESWAKDIILGVGNYGEIFERNLGEKTSLKLKRELNNLWTNGGLHYSPPMR